MTLSFLFVGRSNKVGIEIFYFKHPNINLKIILIKKEKGKPRSMDLPLLETEITKI